MATNVNAGEVKRGDMFILDPNEIQMKEEDRGRFTPPTEEQIIELALSILAHGQRQPVECRKIEGDRLKLTMGYTRMAAIRLIREGFTAHGEFHHDPEFRIKCLVTRDNEEVAFTHNIVENRHRNQTSPIDDAHNQERLRDRYGKTDLEISRLYGLPVAQVSQLSRLLGLERDHQQLVHEGLMPVTAAIAILDMPEAERHVVVKNATSNGKVKGTEVTKQVRDHHLRDEEAPNTTATVKPKRLSRSLSEVREFFEAEGLGEGYKAAFAKSMVSFIKGEITQEKFKAAFDSIR